MAYIGDSCLKIGDEKLFVGDSISFIPNATITPEVVQVSVNSYARLDATGTYSDDELDTIDYVWSVSYSPHDSSVGITNALVISDEGKVASVLLDKVGAYRISLIAKGASGGCSQVAYANIVAVPFVSAHSDQTALDTSWIWQMLPSFWSKMDNVDRKRIETFWRGINQVVSSDLLEAYNIQANQSIASIQKNIIKRWAKIDLSFKPSDYKIIIRNNDSTVLSNIVTDNGLMKSATVDDGYNNSRAISCSATVIGDSELFVGKHLLQNISGSDIAITFQLSAKNIVIRNKVLLSSADGLTTKLTLANKLSLVSTDIMLGMQCNAEILVKKNTDIARVVGEYSEYVSQYIRAVNTVYFLNEIPSVLQSQQFYAVKSSNILLPDAEKMGVSAGDIVFITIRDVDRNYSKDIRFKVIGVDDKFIAIDIYNTLLFEIDSLLKVFESDIYSQDLVSTFISHVTSTDFLSRYGDIDIGKDEYLIVQLDDSFVRRYAWSIRRIVRTKRVPVGKDVVSLVRLVENIERTHFYDNRVILEHDYQYAVSRKPFDLVENLAFYLQPSKVTGGALRRSSTFQNVLICSKYNFGQASINVGDAIYIKDGPAQGIYRILGVNEISLLIDADIPMFRNATFTITRKSQRDNRFLVFNPRLEMEDDVIDNLWSEASIVDNSDAVDINFGSLLNFTYDEWDSRDLSTSYYNATIGLLIAKMSAPSIKTMELASAIIAGIPFSESKSRIVDIKLDYEVDTVTGDVIESMMLLEELDAYDKPTGIYKTYKLPADTARTDSDTTGIAYTDDKKRRLTVGDIVDRYKVLALGAYIADLYKDAAKNNFTNVKDRHKFLIKINVDSAKLTGGALTFLNEFILEIKPSYTKYMLSLLKYVVDEIKITDNVSMAIKMPLFDNPYLYRNVGQVHDYFKALYQLNDKPNFIVLTTNYPVDGALSPINNSFSTLTSTSSTFTQQVHGFKIRSKSTNPGNPDQVWLRSGEFKKLYDVYDILDDNTIKINAKITGSGVAFVIIRQIKFELYSGLLSRDGVLGKIPVNSIDCEAVQGDLIVFDKPNEPALEIVGVENGLIKTVPTFTSSTSTTGAKILRKSLEVSDVASILIESVEGTKCIISNTLNAYYLRIQPGDKLVSPDVESLVTFVSTNNYVHCYPPIHAGNYRVKRSVDTNQSSDYQDAVDEFCKSYQDVSYIKLSEFLITFSSGRFNIPNDLTSFLKPADIVYTSSDNDVGEGKGVYRIVNTIGDMAEICHDLTGDFLCSIIRQVPLRRLYIDDTGIINKLPQILQGPNI